MKKIFLLLAALGIIMLSGCTGPQGPPGYSVSVYSEVFELSNVNFTLNNNNQYTIYQTLNPNIFDSDNILIYILSGTIDANTPIWQLIPRTLSLPQGNLNYDYDFSKEDFQIYASGNFNVALAPTYINNQTFRIVIIPGYFSNKKQGVDFNDYHAVIKAYGLNDTHPKILNAK